MRQRTRACSVRQRWKASARELCGSVTGVTTNAPPSCGTICCDRPANWASRSISTVCAIRNTALATLRDYGARYHGWIPNASAPEVFAHHLFTVHVPRRYYATHLPGIPTIRVFEALACGIPLLSAPWQDSEGLFTPGKDFLMPRDPAEMTRMMRDVMRDAALRASLAAHGLATIRAHHTCDHRADELLKVAAHLQTAEAA